MGYTYGDQTVKLESFLISKAKAGQLVTYKEACVPAGFAGQPYHPQFWSMLGEISIETQYADNILLSAIVVNAESGYPGKSFFELAANQCNKVFRDDLEFWCREVQKVFNHARAKY